MEKFLGRDSESDADESGYERFPWEQHVTIFEMNGRLAKMSCYPAEGLPVLGICFLEDPYEPSLAFE